MKTRFIAFLIILIFLTPLLIANHLYAAGEHPAITPVNANQLQALHLLGKGEVYALNWDPSGKILVVSTSRGIWLYGAEQPSNEPFRLDSSPSAKSVFSADGTQMATFSRTHSILVWDFAARKLLKEIAIPNQDADKAQGIVFGVSFTSDNQPLVTSGYDYNTGFHTWNGDTGETLLDDKELKGYFREAITSPDGATLALIVGADNPNQAVVQLWDLKTGKQTGKLQADFDSMTNSVAFSPDMSTIVTGHGNVRSDYMDSTVDNVAVLWDSKTHQKRSMLEGHSLWITQTLFSSDGQLVASSSADGSVRIWNMNDLSKKPMILDTQNGIALDMAFSPLGDRLAVTTGGGQITLWDLERGKAITSIDGFSGTVSPYVGPGGIGSACCIYWTSDSSHIFTAQANGLIPVWNALDGKRQLIIHAAKEVVAGLAFNPITHTLATSGFDNRITFWNLDSGAQQVSFQAPLKEDGAERNYSNFELSPDGQYITAHNGYSYGEIELRRVKDFSLMQSFDYYAEISARLPTFSPDSSLLALDQDGTINVYQLDTMRVIRLFPHFARGKCGDTCENLLTTITFDPTGKKIGALSAQGDVMVWDIKSSKMLVDFTLNNHLTDSYYQTYLTFNQNLTQVAGFNSDKEVASTPDGIELYKGHVWDQTGMIVSTFEASAGIPKFNPQGTILAIGEGHSGVVLIDAKTGEQRVWLHIPEYDPDNQQLQSFEFSPDGSMLALQGWDDAITLFGIP